MHRSSVSLSLAIIATLTVGAKSAQAVSITSDMIEIRGSDGVTVKAVSGTAEGTSGNCQWSGPGAPLNFQCETTSISVPFTFTAGTFPADVAIFLTNPDGSLSDVVTVDFHVDLPELYPASFSFSPAIADGTLLRYTMCDWIDNAIALQMGRGEGEIYGYLHLPCRIEINARLRQEVPRPEAPLTEKRVG